MKEKLKGLVSNIWYIVALVAACTIIMVLIFNWNGVVEVIGRFISVLMPFIIAFFLAYLINPLVKLINKQFDRIKKGKLPRVKKAVSVLLSYVLVIGVIVLLIVYIFPQIKASISELGRSIGEGYDYVSSNREKIAQTIPFLDIDQIMNYLKTNVASEWMNYSKNIFPYVFELSSSVFSLVYNIILGIVISVYIVLDSDKLVKNLKRIVFALSPKEKASTVWKTFLKCNHIFNGFLFGKAIDSLIIGLICLIAMSIMQMPYALLISVIVCITNMIPYFGPFIGAVPGVLIYLFIDPKLSLIFALWILILQQFDGLYLGPKILGDLTGIKPLWVIFGITVGGAYFGVMGMFLGVPTVAVITYLFDLFLEKKLKKKNIDSANI